MDASVTWQGGLSFTGTADTGFTLDLDGNPASGGGGNGFRPLQLMAISLAGCTAMDVISILRKMRQEVTGFEVKVHADRAASHPRVFTAVTIEYVVTGHNVDPAAVERAIALSTEIYCSAHAMLAQAMPIQTNYRIVAAAAAEAAT